MKLLRGEKMAAKATSSTIPRFWFLVKIEYASGGSMGASLGADEVVVDTTGFSPFPLSFPLIDIEQQVLKGTVQSWRFLRNHRSC